MRAVKHAGPPDLAKCAGRRRRATDMAVLRTWRSNTMSPPNSSTMMRTTSANRGSAFVLPPVRPVLLVRQHRLPAKSKVESRGPSDGDSSCRWLRSLQPEDFLAFESGQIHCCARREGHQLPYGIGKVGGREEPPIRVAVGQGDPQRAGEPRDG